MLARFALILAMYAVPLHARALEIPAWVEHGILFAETSSKLIDEQIIFKNRATGKAGELGPYQMTRAAFDVVKKNGERFENLTKDMQLARDCFERYIGWLYVNFSGYDWDLAVRRWNIGPHGESHLGTAYLNRVKTGAGHARVR